MRVANLSTRLRRCDGGGMAAYDRLPPPLRAWLQQAALPWSPRAALRLWRKARDPAAALARLTRAEQAALQRDRLRLRQSSAGRCRPANLPAGPHPERW